MTGWLAGLARLAKLLAANRAGGSLRRRPRRFTRPVDDRANGILAFVRRETEFAQAAAARLLCGLRGGSGGFLGSVGVGADEAFFRAGAGEQGRDQCAGSEASGKSDERRFIERVPGTISGVAVGFDRALAA